MEGNLKHIVILFHELQRQRNKFLIHALSAAWSKMGLRVSFIYGTDDRPEAELLIPQIDLTHTPREYMDYIKSYSNVVNRDIINISKRKISANLLQGDEDYQGPVIVKTDNNFGGLPEYRISKIHNRFVSMAMHIVISIAEISSGNRLSWRKTLRRYPVYDSLTDVPEGVYKNRALIVEKFLPEKEGSRYFMRHYLFLGDHIRSVRVAGPTYFLKRSECTLVDEGLPVPVQVINLRHQLGMDYGKIDYVINGDQVVILDVNRTPGKPGKPSATAITVGDLADGIWSLMPNK